MSGTPPVNDSSPRLARRGACLLLLALVGWGAWAGWSLWQARRAAVVLNETIQRDWPADSRPKVGTRNRLLTAADHLQQGDWSAVVADLGPIEPPTRSQDVGARRFFADNEALRQRFTTAAAVARSLEESGVDVDGVRDALARAVRAAGEKDEPATMAYVAVAEDLLRETEFGSVSNSGGSDASAVAAMVDSVGPSFLLAQDLLTEGAVAPEKLLSRAAWSAGAGEFRRAVVLIQLAGELLDSQVSRGVSRDGASDRKTPEWFDALAAEPVLTATQTQAQAAVALAEVMIESEMTVEPVDPAIEESGDTSSDMSAGASADRPADVDDASASGGDEASAPEEEPTRPVGPVFTLLDKARLELAAGRAAEAYWWASVALNALGMTDESIDLATVDAP